MSSGPKRQSDFLLWKLPRGFYYVAILVTCAALIPPALIIRARSVPREARRIHIIQNMDNQPKYKAQQQNILFRDGRAMRQPVPGTVARSQMVGDTHFFLGTVDGGYATAFPDQVTVDMDLLERGRDRYMIYCLPCHGVTAAGDGLVHDRAMMLLNLSPTLNNGTTWVQPKNLHEEAIAEQPVGQLFYTISNGKNNMASYAAQITVEDRWAVVAYVKALQEAGNADASAVPGADSLPERKMVLDDEEAATTTDSDATEGAAP
ncbi:MAG: cytochrome c [Phycisphaerales bacterium]|nr:cytochrome c [Phycisphaerales bacterium]